MENIDWDKAPEGATHAGMHSSGCVHYFYNLESKVADYEYWNARLDDDKWHIGRGTPSIKQLIPRPSQSWSGEGLPPVGCKVEYLTYGYEWKGGTYIGNFNGQIVVGCDGSGVVGIVGSKELRPIRTPEHIAAEEREAAVKDACADISNTIQAIAGYVPVDRAAEKVVRAMIEAGYRKP